MTKRVKLTEKQIKKAINEISYGTIKNAYDKDYDLFNSLNHDFENFYDSLKETESYFDYFQREFYNNRNFNIFNPNKNNIYHNKINSLSFKIENGLSQLKQMSDELNSILLRKNDQIDNFNKEIYKADSNTNNDWTDNFDDKEIRDLQNA